MRSNGESDVPHGNDGDNHSSLKWEDFTMEISAEDLNYTVLVNHTSLEPQLANDFLYMATFIVALLLMVISICGNMTVFIVTTHRICRESSISSVHHFLCHLAAADILVTIVFIPAQAGWIRTGEWRQDGDATCKTFGFLYILGRYMAASLVVCITIDRYMETVRKIRGLDIRQRTGVMIILAWAASLFCSAAEGVLYGVHSYPYPSLWAICSTGSFSSASAEVAYDVIKTTLLCGVPITVTVVCYTSIFWKVFRSQSGAVENDGRRNVLALIKKRTVKLSIITGVVFCICWGPPFLMKLWYWIHEDSARMINPQVWKLLLLFACSSTCFHPAVYSYFYLKRK